MINWHYYYLMSSVGELQNNISLLLKCNIMKHAFVLTLDKYIDHKQLFKLYTTLSLIYK